MAKKARQRISYVLPLANSPGGHRLGVNGLAIDPVRSILYTGGRDGAICSWNLDLDLSENRAFDDVHSTSNGLNPGLPSTSSKKTTFRAQTQAHTHWVNDIVLTDDYSALVSASSDLTVRIWRPDANSTQAPLAIGQHADYVKCVATPNAHTDWVASGGLDRKICLWDLNGAGQKLEIAVGDEEKSEKGSVYALSVSNTMLASGGPESILRLWDPRSGNRITKFVGHTDNIRSILINETGDTIMTASSDQTVKVWSVTAGRCMHTLTMHNDSVWSLYSDDPHLEVFYSSDRSGLIVKTDVRGTLGEMDDGLSIAIAQENEGVGKLIAYGDYIWTATSSSSIDRWANVDTSGQVQLPEIFRNQRMSSTESRPEQVSAHKINSRDRKEIPAKAILRISNTATFPAAIARDSETSPSFSALNPKKESETVDDVEGSVVMPIHDLPQETIEGQHGMVKHKLLNDRRRVLTLDTAGDVVLWDLLKSFGKRHLEDVEPEVNTMEAVAPWSSIDTRTGRLAVVLEEYNCFDAEIYADDLVFDEPIEFREDQRINLGKWVLRHIFSKLIDVVIQRDEEYLKLLNAGSSQDFRAKRGGMSIVIPATPLSTWQDGGSSAATPRGNGSNYPMTPGMGIGVATPGASLLPGVSEDGAPLDKKLSHASRTSHDRSSDYFANAPISAVPSAAAAPVTPGAVDTAKSPVDADKVGKDSSTSFGKKFKMGMSFKKGLGRSASVATEKPPAVEEKEEGSETSEAPEKEVDDSFAGIVQRIRLDYDKEVQDAPGETIETNVTPSLPNETPTLRLPSMTTVIIQEETSGGSADLYRGTIATVGDDADIIMQKAPMWLGDLLLRNQIPIKEPVKVSFVLQPWQDQLPSIAGADGNSRLNANRMLRVKKILGYVAERIEPVLEQPDPEAMKPEEYLELLCYDQVLPTKLTLATLRAHIWKGGADVMLFYRSNGRKVIQTRASVEDAVPNMSSDPNEEAGSTVA